MFYFMLNKHLNIFIPVLIVGFLALLGLYVNHKTTELKDYVDDQVGGLLFVGAPTSTPMRNVLPITDNKFDIGTTSPALEWKNVYTKNLTVSGTCTGCGAVGGAATPFPVTTIGGTVHAASSTLPFYFGQGLLTSSSTIGTLTAGAITATSSLTVTGLTSALTLTDANGLFAEYTGTSCTNQFPRSLDAAGAATCATVIATDVDLADLTATNGTLTFSGTYDGQIARTIGLNLGNINIWTALQTYNAGIIGASSTFTGDLQIQKLFASSSLFVVGSSTFQNVINVGGTDATSTFNSGMKIRSGCYETATSSCLTNTSSFTFSIASSTMSTSTRARQFRLPVDFDITKVSCVTYGASAAIQLDERSAPQTAGTNVLSAALTCTTSGAATQTFTNRFITQDNFVNLQITDAQPGVARPTILEVHIYGEKIQ